MDVSSPANKYKRAPRIRIEAHRTRGRSRDAEIQGYGQDSNCMEGGADAIGIGPEPGKRSSTNIIGLIRPSWAGLRPAGQFPAVGLCSLGPPTSPHSAKQRVIRQRPKPTTSNARSFPWSYHLPSFPGLTHVLPCHKGFNTRFTDIRPFWEMRKGHKRTLLRSILHVIGRFPKPLNLPLKKPLRSCTDSGGRINNSKATLFAAPM